MLPGWKIVILMMLLIGIFNILLVAAPFTDHANVGFAEDNVTIKTASGDSIHFSVELALTREQQSRGLMFRDRIPDNHAMLFYDGHDKIFNMWMKNTAIPLDMLFIAEDGTIRHIVHHATSYSEDIISFSEPVAAVMEIKGGIANRLAIGVGDTVKHRFFQNSGKNSDKNNEQ